MTAQNAKPWNARIGKELRLLRLPGAVAAIAACLVPILAGLQATTPDEGLFSLGGALAWAGFLGSILLIGAAGFGWEFQHRTLALLLAQPIGRTRIWGEKMLAAALWVLPACALLPMAGLLSGWYVSRMPTVLQNPPPVVAELPLPTDFGLLLLFVPAAVCAAPVWTLLARSTVGGVAFTVLFQFLAAVAVEFVAGKLHVNSGLALTVAGVVYCLVFLRLGWRLFSTLQVTDGTSVALACAEDLVAGGEAGASRAGRWRTWAGRMAGGAWLDRALRCGPSGATANLFRKELRLQKPLYQLGVFFAWCWLAVLIVNLLQPDKGYEEYFNMLIVVFLPLVFLLAGSIGISDDQTLGVAGWHLTLPVRAGKQWAMKVVSGAAAGVVIGWGLPLVLICATSLVVEEYSGNWVWGEGGIICAYISLSLYIASFWAVSLVGTTVRAVPTALATLFTLFLCFLLGHWWAGLRAWGYDATKLLPYVMNAIYLALLAIALAQTLRPLWRPGTWRKPFVLYASVLVLGAVLMGATVSVLGR